MRKTLLAVLSLIAMPALLAGCGDIVTFNAKGQVGVEQGNLIILAFALMLIVVIPAILMTFWFGWKYRESNKLAEYLPNWSHSTKIEVVVWGVPCIIIAALAYVTYVSSHELDPYKTIESDKPALEINVIAKPFKWVFIYPEENIATVNEISIPVDRPVTFNITSDFTMNSFFIPHLGGMVYAMAGMRTQLNLIANEAGEFRGLSANYAGHGFSRMRFKVHAVSDQAYADWVAKAKASSDTLDQATYDALRDYSQQGVAEAKAASHHEPLEPAPVQYFGTVEPGLFKAVIDKYMTAKHAGHGHGAKDAGHAAEQHSTEAEHSTTPAHAGAAGGH